MPDKIFYNWEFKALFQCRQCKFSMYKSVAKLPCDKVSVAKFPATSLHTAHCGIVFIFLGVDTFRSYSINSRD